jgi:hypothetical protein
MSYPTNSLQSSRISVGVSFEFAGITDVSLYSRLYLPNCECRRNFWISLVITSPPLQRAILANKRGTRPYEATQPLVGLLQNTPSKAHILLPPTVLWNSSKDTVSKAPSPQDALRLAVENKYRENSPISESHPSSLHRFFEAMSAYLLIP